AALTCCTKLCFSSRRRHTRSKRDWSSAVSSSDLLYKQGNNFEAQRFFGSHLTEQGGEKGVMFRLWAPHATAVSVVGDFNSWKPRSGERRVGNRGRGLRRREGLHWKWSASKW